MDIKAMRRRDNLRGVLIYAMFVLVALILIGGTIGSYYGCVVEQGRQDAIDGGVIAEAEIVGIDDMTKTSTKYGGPGLYELVYGYTDATGIKYKGYTERGIKSRKYAESQIGKKVNIYI